MRFVLALAVILFTSHSIAEKPAAPAVKKPIAQKLVITFPSNDIYTIENPLYPKNLEEIISAQYLTSPDIQKWTKNLEKTTALSKENYNSCIKDQLINNYRLNGKSVHSAQSAAILCLTFEPQEKKIEASYMLQSKESEKLIVLRSNRMSVLKEAMGLIAGSSTGTTGDKKLVEALRDICTKTTGYSSCFKLDCSSGNSTNCPSKPVCENMESFPRGYITYMDLKNELLLHTDKEHRKDLSRVLPQELLTRLFPDEEEDNEAYDDEDTPSVKCLSCPVGSNSRGGRYCIDKHGCSIFTQEYSTRQKQCVPKYCTYKKIKVDDLCVESCNHNCKRNLEILKSVKNHALQQPNDNARAISLKYIFPVYGMPALEIENPGEFAKNVLLEIDTAIGKINNKMETCTSIKHNSSCEDIMAELKNYIRSYITSQCKKGEFFDGRICISKACQKCSNLQDGLEVLFGEFGSVYIPPVGTCGHYELLYAHQNMLTQYLGELSARQNLCLKHNNPSYCDFDINITQQDLSNFMIAQNYDCAREAVPQKSTPKGKTTQ